MDDEQTVQRTSGATEHRSDAGFIDRHGSKKLSYAGVALAVVGSFLPWVNLGAISVNGVQGGDGVFSLVLAGIAGAVVLFHGWGRVDKAIVGVSGVLVALLTLLYIVDPGMGVPQDNPFRGALSTGFGIYVTFVGGLVMVGASLYDRLSGDEPEPTPDTAGYNEST